MKHKLAILLFAAVFPAMVYANEYTGHQKQERPVRKPANKQKERFIDKIVRIKMMRSAFITRQLDLTPAQNEKFWPIYNQYQDELTAAQVERRINNSPNGPKGLEQLTKDRAITRKIADIKDHYQTEFLKILPPEKVSMIYQSEQQFNDELFRKYNGEKNQANN
ncbi:hypothetical protein BEL04_09785 [Mucilaginibacter sp. PPCGB 2223]|uniref:hypothetical protein n=1 Tax=Mucilaginibacter sp. PPCGB 2223 TaxID=1886027 RepID=UPI00082560B7|nr:hypothetical protein [Mucilaginibacter sp. PPCGB 2223]OCX54516.1 hypothetical protein BEL04_09785 [Mucilaginibacter sp. PPCGB 2223]